VKIDVQGVQSLEIKLEIGEVTGNTVTVNAEAISINADTPVRQSNVSERQVRELPLLVGGEDEGRSPLSFIFLDSNVVRRHEAAHKQFEFRVSGGQASGTEILIDGAAVRRQQNGTFVQRNAPVRTLSRMYDFDQQFSRLNSAILGRRRQSYFASGGNDFHGEGIIIDETKNLTQRHIDKCVPEDWRRATATIETITAFNVAVRFTFRFGEGTPGRLVSRLKTARFSFSITKAIVS
jgi:hypothetical protein